MAKANKETKTIEIKKIEFNELEFSIVGTSPLITNPITNKIGTLASLPGSLYADTVKKKNKGKIIPFNDFIESLYWLTERPELGETDEEAEKNFLEAVKKDGGHFGFPITGIKQSIISGAYRAGLDVKMTELRGAFFLEGATEYSTTDYAEIIGPLPEIREDIGRNSGITRAPKFCFRPEFKTWEIPLKIRYMSNGQYTIGQLLNLVNYGGFVTGIGEWRPEKDGQFGMYELKTN